MIMISATYRTINIYTLGIANIPQWVYIHTVVLLSFVIYLCYILIWCVTINLWWYVFSDAWGEFHPLKRRCCSLQQHCDTPGCPSPIWSWLSVLPVVPPVLLCWNSRYQHNSSVEVNTYYSNLHTINNKCHNPHYNLLCWAKELSNLQTLAYLYLTLGMEYTVSSSAHLMGQLQAIYKL